MKMMTSRQIVDIISHEPYLENKTCCIWLTTDGKNDIVNIEKFRTVDELAEFLSGISLTHFVEDVHRFDSRTHTDIDIFMDESTNGRTNIDANVVESILDYFLKIQD
jgi:hypothetical protein